MNIPARISTFLKSLRVDLVEIRGNCRETGTPASVVCAVGEKTNYYLAGLLFEAGFQLKPLGSAWLWSAAAVARRSTSAGILFLETGRTNKKLRFYGERYFRIPLWIQGQVDLPLDERFTKKKDYREQVRKIRKAGFDYEVTRETSLFEDFYENMYVPQISGSHGNSKRIASGKVLTEDFADFELLCIMQGQRFVAGELISYTDPVPKLRAVGVRDRDPALLKAGALSACYYYAFQHLQQQGYSQVCLGDSRGFINDGVLTAKRKWGQVLVECRPYLLLMRILQDTPATRALLRSLPIICENSGQLESMVFLDPDELEAARASQKFLDHHHIPGTVRLLACIMSDRMAYSKSALRRLDG